MRLLRTAVCLWTIASLAACGKNSQSQENAAPVSAQFLELADVTPTAVLPVDKDDMLSSLSDVSDLYDNEPDDDAAGTDDSQDSQKCFQDIYDASKVKAAGDTIEMAIVGDFTACLADAMKAPTADSSPSALSLQLSKASFRIGATMRCEGADLSTYNGKSFSDLAKDAGALDTLCGPAAKSYSRVNSQSEMAGSLTFLGINAQFDTITSSLEAQADGSPCEATKQADGSLLLTDGCTNQELTKHVLDTNNGTATEKQGKEDYTKIVWQGRQSAGDNAAVWYTAGTAAVTINDWQGSVTYAAAATAPTYSMHKGSDAATGTLSPPASTLVGTIQKIAWHLSAHYMARRIR